jgi:hypothetical protein
MQKRGPTDTQRARQASRGRARHAGATPPPKHRRRSTLQAVPRTTGVSGTKPGTVSGRSRKKPCLIVPKARV